MTKRNVILRNILTVCASWTLLASSSWGLPHDESTSQVSRTFSVENMTCAACPITVRKAMSRIEGVQNVAVDFDAKTVTVVFDAVLTDSSAIAEASTSIGFPAHALGERHE